MGVKYIAPQEQLQYVPLTEFYNTIILSNFLKFFNLYVDSQFPLFSSPNYSGISLGDKEN